MFDPKLRKRGILPAQSPAFLVAETGIKTIAAAHSQCPLWVKSRHMQRKTPCRFTPNSDIDCDIDP
jgi:hypothetical protein